MSNIFDQFKPTETKHYIESLNGEVTLRSLTLKQIADISNDIMDGLDDEGNPKMDMQKALRVNYLKVSAALVEPKMSPEQLESLSGGAKEAIKEIMYLVDPVAAEAADRAEAEYLGKTAPNEKEA